MIRIRRTTTETRVIVGVRPSDGQASIRVEDRFLRHMLETLARYSGLGLDVEAEGDLGHHIIEDVAITLGTVLREAVPATCARFGEATLPMDDALVQVVLDTGGRSYWSGPLPETMYDHFFRLLAENARFTVHCRVLRGEDRHHVIEAAFKAFGVALRVALKDGDAVFSTKGSVSWERIEDEDVPIGEPGPC